MEEPYILLGIKNLNGCICHSFISFGYIGKKKPTKMVSFGKIFDESSDSYYAQEESSDFFNRYRTINYLAYKINEAQLRRFNIIKENLLTSVPNNKDPEIKSIADSFQKPVYKETCRSNALKVLSYVLEREDLGISRFWFIKPDFCMSSFNEFYVLPALPTKDPVQQKIFKRLHDMVMKNPELEATRDKFAALQYIYENLSKQDFNLNTYIGKNKNVLFAMRNQCFFSRILGLKSSTEKLLNTISSQYNKLNFSQ